MLYDFESEEKYCLDLEKLLNGVKLWAKNPRRLQLLGAD